MKKMILYSKDFTMCYSLLMYLKDIYKVSLTTDQAHLVELVSNYEYDLVLIDMEASEELEELCANLKNTNFSVPIAVIYVYNPHNEEFDDNIRKYVELVFYKPFDPKDVLKELSFLTGSYIERGV